MDRRQSVHLPGYEENSIHGLEAEAHHSTGYRENAAVARGKPLGLRRTALSRQMRTRIPACFRSPVGWLLAGIFALEFFAFDQWGARRHTSIYPRWNDQIQYLSESYTVMSSPGPAESWPAC